MALSPPQAHLLATAGEERCIYLWDIRQPASATAAFIPDAHSSRIRGLAVLPPLTTTQGSPDPPTSPSPSSQPLLLSAASDGCLSLWDLRKLTASAGDSSQAAAGSGSAAPAGGTAGRQLSASPLASMQTGARITCLAFTLLGSRREAEESKAMNGAGSGNVRGG